MLPNITKIEYLVRPWPVYPLLKEPLARLAAWQWTHFPSLPPPLPVKAALLKKTARRHSLRTLVETGTFFGDLIAVLEKDFDRIISIELDARLSALARTRFAGMDKVTIIQGDSGEKLQEVLHDLGQPALFWLDGHFSGGVTARSETDTPIMAELRNLFASAIPHVILIDDARLFGTHPDYPPVGTIEALVREHRPGWTVSLQTDVLCIQPN